MSSSPGVGGIQDVLDGLAAHVAVLAADGRITLVNEAWRQFARASGDPELRATGPGVDYLAACRDDGLPFGETAVRAATGVRSVLQRERTDFSLEYPCPTPQGVRWFVLLVVPYGDTGAVVTHVDVTADRRPMDDPLSPVPSRTLVEGQVEAAIASAHPDGAEVAVLYLDVDDFKEVNDTLGHDVGDQLLLAVADRVRATTPSGTSVRRYASDEFVVVVPAAGRAEAAEVAAELGRCLREPFELSGDRVMVTVSIGVACYPTDARVARELVRCADAAMGEGKRGGRDTWRFFDPGVAARRHRRLTLGNALRGALHRHEFQLHYQPQVGLADGSVVGVEALLRWHVEGLGDPRPAEFVPVAESTGRIVPIGWWALHEAVAQVTRWRDEGLLLDALAVNVSGRHFSQPGFAERLLALLGGFDWPAERLELEITEHQALRQRDTSIRVMEDLQREGVRFALDDFGSGYSSVVNLRAFPLHTAKIDASFVGAIGDDERSSALVGSMVALIGSLGLTSVAEGVQTEEQVTFLASVGCDVVQGFRYAPGMPPDVAATWLRERR
ncbi:MAG: bifunctional diguanylate cyclase/phosphodiesterase [Candidatus Nanopelagicales bacterium]|nr:bifunctional diguanylate cyclase/phosphodiesterase [Candidatus Nanopelagicales bacterium]